MISARMGAINTEGQERSPVAVEWGVMCGITLAAVIFIACAAVAHVVVERRWRWRWREIEVGRKPAVDGGGAYRDGGDVPRFAARAPFAVRAVAFASLLLGQLFVPIVVAGTGALLLFGLGVLAIPALVATAKLYRAGLSLLRRDPRLAYFRARDAAAWTGWVSGAMLLIDVLAAHSFAGIVGMRFVFIIGGIAVCGLVQTRALLWVTRRSEDALFAASHRPTIVL
jgi:hypothetical protein